MDLINDKKEFQQMSSDLGNAITLGGNSVAHQTLSQGIPSDIRVEVDGISFFLHKFPLVSRSGRIRKRVVAAGQCGQELDVLVLDGVPGGASAFEVAARFCYGQQVEIGEGSVASIRCVAEYLEMSDAAICSGVGPNLIEKCESILEETLVEPERHIRRCVCILRSCEKLLPDAESLGIVNRCIDSIARDACGPYNKEPDHKEEEEEEEEEEEDTMLKPASRQQARLEEVSRVLYFGFFKRIVVAMKARGVHDHDLGAVIVHYAQRVLPALRTRNWGSSPSHMSSGMQSSLSIADAMPPSLALDAIAAARNASVAERLETLKEEEEEEEEEEEDHDDDDDDGDGEAKEDFQEMEYDEAGQRVMVEEIVGLLPMDLADHGTMASFLFGLLRAATDLDTSLACRLAIEKRISLRLEHAAPLDLLIPLNSFYGDALFDTDSVRRIFIDFLRHEIRKKRWQQQQLQQQQQQQQQQLQSRIHGYGLVSMALPPPDSALHLLDQAIDMAEYEEVFRKPASTNASRLAKVVWLLDGFLAEIATDTNLGPAEFFAMADLLPGNARGVHDGLYRAVDIYLKVHPDLGDPDRKMICSVLEAEKLTEEACTHAARNDRLSIQLSVQVLYCEQKKLKSAMSSSLAAPEMTTTRHDKTRSARTRHRRMSTSMSSPSLNLSAMARYAMPGAAVHNDDHDENDHDHDHDHNDDDDDDDDDDVHAYDEVCRENQRLKMEMARMQELLGANNGGGRATMSNKSRPMSNKLLHSVSKTLGKLIPNPFHRPTTSKVNVITDHLEDGRAPNPPPPASGSGSRNRRYSIS